MADRVVLVTVTAFDDVSRVSASRFTFGELSGSLSAVVASEVVWREILASVPDGACLRIGVVDRRPGTVATSRALGTVLTAAPITQAEVRRFSDTGAGVSAVSDEDRRAMADKAAREWNEDAGGVCEHGYAQGCRACSPDA